MLTQLGIVDAGNVETPPTGKYVSKVDLQNNVGTIVITYSAVAPFQANKAIDTKTLALEPYVSKNQDVIWRCGRAAEPLGGGAVKTDQAGTASADSFAATTVLPKYTPQVCRQ
jgi:hypothetical protein